MIAVWILLYFFCHGIAHWTAGRLVGIRFAFYTIGGTGNPEGYPAGLRWVFEHLPFFGVQTEKPSMQKASPKAKAVMWSAGVTSSIVIPTLGALWPGICVFREVRRFYCLQCFGQVGTCPAIGGVARETLPKQDAR